MEIEFSLHVRAFETIYALLPFSFCWHTLASLRDEVDSKSENIKHTHLQLHSGTYTRITI